MSIQSIQLNLQTFDELGIGKATLPLEPPLHLHSLGNVVVLAGPNGAGKTRLLRLLRLLAQKALTQNAVKEQQLQAATLTQDLATVQKNLNDLRSPSANASNHDIAISERAVANINRQLEDIARALRGSTVLTVDPPGPFAVLDFVPKQSSLKDPSLVSDSDANKRAAAMRNGGSENAEQNAPAHARLIMRAALNAHRRRMKSRINTKSDEELAEERLIAIIRDLLGPSITLDLTDDLNLRVGQLENYWTVLSAGQQVLFQFACMLHAQDEELQDSILLMDEPENHLHPAVLNEVIDRLRLAPGRRQVWVATHSVPLIAHLAAKDPDCLWYAEDGRFERAGRTPARVLDGLMGGPDGAANLQALTRLPAEYASLRFMAECLVEPEVAGPNINDPQTHQIAGIIGARAKGNAGRLRIVDFGAGVGRLLPILAAQVQARKLPDFIDYLAVEREVANHSELGKEIEAAYESNSSGRIFTELPQLAEQIEAASVDCIVMCNVLHELDPNDWTTLLDKSSPLMRVLADDGFLLIVEDYGLPIGERAHRFGFLLLDEQELKKLFSIDGSDIATGRFIRESSSEPRYKDRLVAHSISKACAQRLSPITRREAITALHSRMTTVVEQALSKQDTAQTSASGRHYARAMQLLAGSLIWLRQNPTVVNDR